MKRVFITFITGVILITVGCSKKDDYTKYLEGGEIRYAAKPEDLKAFPGKERIKLQWRILSDQNITKAKVYWRNKSDSMEVLIDRGLGIDTINVTLPLSEGAYSFDVVHFHENGVKSLKSNVSSNSYGDSYLSTLINRGVSSYTIAASNKGISFNWGPAENTVIGTRINYTNINNDAREFVVARDAKTSVYTNILLNSVLEYRTMYKPDSLSIDTFYSPVTRIPIKY